MKLPERYRTDLNLLGWVDNLYEYTSKYPRYSSMNKLVLEADEMGQACVLKMNGEVCGRYRDGVLFADSGKALKKSGRDIVPNPLLDMPLMPRSTYKIDNYIANETDELGRVISTKTIKPLELVDKVRSTLSQSYTNATRDGLYRDAAGTHDVAGYIIGRRF